MKPRIEIVFETNKPTPDDWSPTFPDGTVEIRQYSYPENELYKTIVRGADDTVMGLYCNGKSEADNIVRWINGLAFISKCDLLNFGFEYE